MFFYTSNYAKISSMLQKKKEDEMYLTNEEFNRYFDYLKVLGLEDYFGWDEHPARKEHTDMYGVKIEKGETHFDITIKRNVIKFSRQSMDEYLYLLFKGTPLLQDNAKRLIEAKKEKNKEAIEKMPL